MGSAARDGDRALLHQDEMLEQYLNLVYLGSGAYGVDAAARTYFGRGVIHATAGRAAMIARRGRGTVEYSPYVSRSSPRAARRATTLAAFITQAQATTRRRADRARGRTAKGLQGYSSPYFDLRDLAAAETVRRAGRARKAGYRSTPRPSIPNSGGRPRGGRLHQRRWPKYRRARSRARPPEHR